MRGLTRGILEERELMGTVGLISFKTQGFPQGRNLDVACDESEQIADKSRAFETRNVPISTRNNM